MVDKGDEGGVVFVLTNCTPPGQTLHNRVQCSITQLSTTPLNTTPHLYAAREVPVCEKDGKAEGGGVVLAELLQEQLLRLVTPRAEVVPQLDILGSDLKYKQQCFPSLWHGSRDRRTVQ